MNTDACTLPAAERPLRLAEFDELFTSALREISEISPTLVRLRLAAPAAKVRDLTARETECCSFFTFTVRGQDGALTLDIEVPPAQADVVAALVARARAVSVADQQLPPGDRRRDCG